MDPQKITELAKLLRNNGDKILSSEFKLTLSASLLRALNDSFTLIAECIEIGDTQNFQVVKSLDFNSPVFRELQLVHDFVQKTALLCIIQYPNDECTDGKIDIRKFRALKRLELQKVQIKEVCGIQQLRAQLQHLICTKSINCVDDIITHCGGDNSNGFVWNELRIADFSYNNLQNVDSSLEFAQYLQHLNLRHNKLQSVKAIKWLPNLKTLDLSFNRLQSIPQFHMDAYKRLQSLNMSNNLLEDLTGIVKLDALTDLDISDNCLLDHTFLLPLTTISTLRFLNLYGNPLQCHPKHRLASSQYLHKKCSTVKFILDFEPLSKNEKSLTGTQNIKFEGAPSHYTTRSSTSSTPTVGRLTPSSYSSPTPSSSVGSIGSFKINGSNYTSETDNIEEVNLNTSRKKWFKIRQVDIEDEVLGCDTPLNSSVVMENTEVSANCLSEETNDHLEIKGQIVNLRKKYGNEWLHTSNVEIRNSVLGIFPANSAGENIDRERQKSREMFNEYIKDCFEDSKNDATSTTIRTSTPTNTSCNNSITGLIMTPIKPDSEHNETSSIYESLQQTETLFNTTADSTTTAYKSLDNNKIEGKNNFDDNEKCVGTIHQDNVKEKMEEHDILSTIYSSTNNHYEEKEEEFSEREEDEEIYIVHTTNQNEAIFLTKSCNFLRERDPLTQRTKTKWSLKILESCDRIKSNTLRINFDTVKEDKQERVYTVEEGLCHELEKKLRDILSQRDLNEMNQTIYRCVNCNCQFSHETKTEFNNSEVHCPDCRSWFVAEIHDIPKSLEKASHVHKLSPASIVEELPRSIIPLTVEEQLTFRSTSAELGDDSYSIGSANSLNESSCSKITVNSHSESSFNSNQSLVGSSNTDRDLDFKTNGESDIDIISNPSQSSIEVLDPCASRNNWEERRNAAHIRHLETIDDQSYTQTFLEREFDNMINYANKDKGKPEEYLQTEYQVGGIKTQRHEEGKMAVKKNGSLIANNNLTESSSSGSVTDSVCTSYEQKEDKSVESSTEEKNKLLKELPQHDNQEKKAENTGLSSIFGALKQSTNILMASSKYIMESEGLSNVKSGAILPTSSTTNSQIISTSRSYKFNYTDFNDVDHRLKLYFYTTKFDKDERFKWIVKGRIYNQLSKELTDGLIVMSTCKLYLMEAYSAENDDVTKWLRFVTTCTVDRLTTIQLLPWKIGLSFYLNDWGGFLLLLQDILRTDSLLLFFANNALPSPCEFIYQPSEISIKRLSAAVIDEQLNIFSLVDGCEITCENAKRSFNVCGLLATDTRIYLTSEKLDWLSDLDSDVDIELCITQFMSNLVEVEYCSDNIFIINFLDETQDKCETWKCIFQTPEYAITCLNSIAQSWEKLFGVPLINT